MSWSVSFLRTCEKRLTVNVAEAIDAIDRALDNKDEARQVLSDVFHVDGFDHRLSEGVCESDKEKRRRLLAGFAAQIYEDRYTAGSTAAKAVDLGHRAILLSCLPRHRGVLCIYVHARTSG